MKWIRRLLPWLAPGITLLLVWQWGQWQRDIPAWDWQTGPGLAPPPPPEFGPPPEAEPVGWLQVQLRSGDGRPAEGALVALLEPEPTVSRADQEGKLRLPLWKEGNYHLLAYFPGHELLRLRGSAGEQVLVLNFEVLDSLEIPPWQPPVEHRRGLELLCADGQVLAGALVVAKKREDSASTWQQGLSWVTISDPHGYAEFPNLPEGKFQVQAYAPGMPPAPPWMLAEWTWNPQESPQPARHSVAAVHLKLIGLPPGEVLEGRRAVEGGALPLRHIGDEGEVSFPPLPPGRYRFLTRDRYLELSLESGSREAHFSTAKIRSGEDGMGGE
ncbi:MAG: carboxypeptidase regulatory-like domain-containing protein [Planctomycetota bacterium]|nr:MAG: carboxypeptidase regulatory-like domain-containing protein [Planctomycetota bacterium]